MIVSFPMPTPVQAGPPQSVSSAVSQIAQSVVSSCVAGQSQSSASGSGSGSKLVLIRCLEPGCDYSTYQKGDYRIHKDKHLGIRYMCPHDGCAKDFGSEKSKMNHFRTVHLNKDRAVCPFPDCGFSHMDHGVTKVHLYTDHGVGQEPKCRHPDCKDRDLFNNYRVYERHIKSYHKAKDAQCCHCNKFYKGMENLKSHIETSHSDKTTVQCDKCGKFYASSKSLDAHKQDQH